MSKMDYVIAKLKLKQGNQISKFKKLLSDATIYVRPDDLDSCVPYDASTNIDDNEWFAIEEFSQQDYCLDFIKQNIDSVTFPQIETAQIENIDFICTCQNSNEFYFQRVAKAQLLSQKIIGLGDAVTYTSNSRSIVLHEIPDAIYLKSLDTLYFKKLSAITSIFKGIDQLFKEATEEETQSFLEKPFIRLESGFNSTLVKKANRKRVALALEALSNFDDVTQKIVFDTVKDYCPQLVADDETFKIETDDDLKLLLFGIDQRFYTTPDGKEKRIANSVIKL